jgi:hypothetical protein
VKRFNPGPFLAFGAFLLAAGWCHAGTFVIDWTYQYGINAAGTKGESVFGKLLYKGDELPERFHHLITPIGEFLYVNAAGSGSIQSIGWVPYGKLDAFPDGRMHPASTDMQVQELMTGNGTGFRRVINRGSPSAGASIIRGDFDHPPHTAGRDWFYAVDKAVWVNPGRLAEAVKALFGSGENSAAH